MLVNIKFKVTLNGRGNRNSEEVEVCFGIPLNHVLTKVVFDVVLLARIL